MLLDNETHTQLVTLRQDLHRHPEISGHEQATSDRIATFLENHAPDELHRNLGGYGVAAVYKGKVPGPGVLIRCELDALPIEELNTAPYRSTIAGKGHLCGHDGHMTMVAGLAALLQRSRPAIGRVILLFQPAEETGAGAKAVIEDPAFAALKPDYAFALHNLPGMPLHHVGLKSGPFNCASQGLWITLTGKTSHASNPEDGQSPALAMCDLIKAFTLLPQDHDFKGEFALVTIVHARLGEEAFGIAPGFAKLMVTLRSETDQIMQLLQEKSRHLIEQISKDHQLETAFGYDDIFAASTNDPDASEQLLQVFEAEEIKHHPMTSPMRWSEDFGQFGQICKSAMFTLGSGLSQPQLHNPDFDFPDELIETGCRIFHRVIRNILGPSN
ncbi:amidohydrolase [Kiloniella laminariae]|uniref:Amidohydrolase n=1 Tax=Kiloniella laminariae TaxID=454162 RepID=A0ABT4LGU8_9PROT|nr:amidohydrolase [Kiloniella laminariae]MCZ4280331.1 amidohydrolase [Kiloniella laminariae]